MQSTVLKRTVEQSASGPSHPIRVVAVVFSFALLQTGALKAQMPSRRAEQRSRVQHSTVQYSLFCSTVQYSRDVYCTQVLHSIRSGLQSTLKTRLDWICNRVLCWIEFEYVAPVLCCAATIERAPLQAKTSYEPSVEESRGEVEGHLRFEWPIFDGADVTGRGQRAVRRDAGER